MYEFQCLLINLLLKRSVQDAQLIDVIQICTPFHLQLKLFWVSVSVKVRWRGMKFQKAEISIIGSAVMTKDSPKSTFMILLK